MAAIVAFHLWHLDQLARWAEAPLETPVPEGRGSWRIAFTALHRRVRARTAYQRDLAHTIERFRSAAEAIPDGMVVLDAANRIRWANARALAHLGLDLAHDAGRPLLNLVRQPEVVRYLETAISAMRSSSIRSARPGVTLSIQVVPFGMDEKLLISRDITRLESVARMRRDFIANVSHELKTPLTVVSGFLETLQDLELEPRQRDALPATDAGAGAQHGAAGRRPADAVGAGERAESADRDRRSRSRRCCSKLSAAARALSDGPARRSRSTSAPRRP